MAWYVNPTLNEGYPTNTGFPASYPADWSGNYPVSAWRVSPGVNDGYPYTWFMIAIDTGKYYDPNIPIGGDLTPPEPSTGDMDIGGSQTNYPNGFTNSNRGGIVTQFNDTAMYYNTGQGSRNLVSGLNSVMANKQFYLSGEELQRVFNTVNGDDLESDDVRAIERLGGTIYNGFLICKAYPFYLHSSAETVDMKLYGRLLISAYKGTPGDAVATLDLGAITLDINQAWEIESVDYSIYLPYAGVFPLDIRNGADILVNCTVDLYNGIGEYHVFQDGQLTGIYRCVIGVDIPINVDQGIMQANLFSNIQTAISQGLPVLTGAIGSAVAGPAGATIGATAGSALGNLYRSSHQQLSAPQVGGLSSIYSYPYARIIAKVPKMHKDGYGYAEILGENRSTTYTNLNSVSGFVQTKNYKCDIINATDAEKREIERLMDSGVIL